MMPKINTALLVIVLSGLIWVFAERKVIKSTTTTVRLELAQSREDLYITYLDDQRVPMPEAPSIRLEVEGPTGPIQDLEEGRVKPRVLPIDVTKLVDLSTAGNEPIDHTFQVASVLEDKLMLEGRQGYLTIEEAKPAELTVRIFRLQHAELEIGVYGAAPSNTPLSAEILEPQSGKLAAYVVSGTAAPQARVTLTAEELSRAQKEPIIVTAKVLAPNRLIEKQVKLKAATMALAGGKGEIERPELSILIPVALQGHYEVIIQDPWRDVYEPILYQAPMGKGAEFQKQQCHLILEVKESDLDDNPPAHSLRYNVPEGSGIQIVNPQKDPVRFKLIPIETVDGPAAS